MGLHDDWRIFLRTIITFKKQQESIEDSWFTIMEEIVENLEELKKNSDCKICAGIYEATSAFFEGFKKLFLLAFVHIFEEVEPLIKDANFFEKLSLKDQFELSIFTLENTRVHLLKLSDKKIEELSIEDIVNIQLDWVFFEGYLEASSKRCKKCRSLLEGLGLIKKIYFQDVLVFISHLPSLPDSFSNINL